MVHRLIDAPIEREDESNLGIRPFAEALHDFVCQCQTPITVGIQGDWGSGKTSLMNIIRNRIEERKPGKTQRAYTLYFNTWQYAQFNQESEMAIAVMRGLVAEIEQQFSAQLNASQTLQDSVRRFGKFVGLLGNQVLAGKFGIDVREALETPRESEDPSIATIIRELKQNFTEVIDAIIGLNANASKGPDRIVVFIDDLDRIRPVKALEILESMKNFLDVPGCVFVLAIDYSVVQRGMEEKLGASARELHGKSYFDKIIQIPFNMPQTSYQIDRYLMELMGWQHDPETGGYVRSKEARRSGLDFLSIKDSRLSQETVDYFANITMLAVGGNPRSIKRVVNYANLLKGVVQNTRRGSGTKWKLEDAQMLYALAALQLAWPEVFDLFSKTPSPEQIKQLEDWEYLKSHRKLQPVFRRSMNDEEVISNISGFFDELIGLVDKNEDGDIQLHELKPLWDIMKDANLTRVSASEMEKQWRHVEELVRRHVEHLDEPRQRYFEQAVSVIAGTRLCNPAHVRIVPAGRKFVNVLWNNRQVASIVSTKSDPLQIYVRPEADRIASRLPEEDARYLEDATHRSHYGIGHTGIRIHALMEDADLGNELQRQRLFDRIWDAACAAIEGE